jgi:glutathione S-transferase
MRLYDYAASANCYKARLLLAQLGLPYERVPVDIFAGESTTPAHRARNPAGRTPVLELDSGETIAESNAILLYLAEGTAFVPDELVRRARRRERAADRSTASPARPPRARGAPSARRRTEPRRR